jgi:hypothetical protein
MRTKHNNDEYSIKDCVPRLTYDDERVHIGKLDEEFSCLNRLGSGQARI